MSQRVCPWWLGYFLASPVRRWISDDPYKLLAPYVHSGMTVLEPGPGMGFFTIPLAKLVGPAGRVIAVDVQPRMIASLKRRIEKKGLSDRVDARVDAADSLDTAELAGKADFILAFAMVHEMPSSAAFFTQAAAAAKPSACLFLAEPAGHVKPETFEQELAKRRRPDFEWRTARRCVAAIRLCCKKRELSDAWSVLVIRGLFYSTVTDLAKLRGWSTSHPRLTAM